MPVTSYSTTAANNNSAAPNGAPEGMAASAVNDTIRQIMTDIAVEAQKNAVKVLASVAGTNTITGSMTPDLTAYSAGMLVVFTPANTNTGAVTLNIDSLGALDVFKPDGSALVAGELVAGIPALLVLDSGADDFILVAPAGATQFLTGVISPSALSAGNNNDYAPTGFSTCNVVRLTPNASGSAITGLAGGVAGRVVNLVNLGSALITLEVESASSTAANRFAIPAQTPISAGNGQRLWYDGTSSRWRVFF